ncbi:alpha/beta fold hydrolase [Herbiconiux sp. UC225_62]|uniref:alpha/beta fold hydrolase n=1 Tax=Herbiconiux sp. UC225_62 TaxID=3350168 RepID=UPI0036D22ACF
MTPHDDYAERAYCHLSNPNGDEVTLLLHGLGADHRQPLALLGDQPLEGSAVLAPDLRAHGATPVVGGAEAFTFAALLDDVRALLERTGQSGKPTHLVGISMGAALALRAALEGAVTVASLTLVRPAFDEHPLPENLRVMALIGDILQTSYGATGKRTLSATPEFRAVAAVSPLGAASLLAQFDDPRAQQRSERLRSVPKNTAYGSPIELGTLSTSTLVIGTDRDPVHPLALAGTWARAIPGARLDVVPARDDDAALNAAVTSRSVLRHLQEARQDSELTVGQRPGQLAV